MSVNERFKEVRKFLKLSQGDFAKELGIQQGSLSDIERSKVGVSSRNIHILKEKFLVNIKWLKDGRGSMFVDEVNKGNLYHAKIMQEEAPGNASINPALSINNNKVGVPFFDIDTIKIVSKFEDEISKAEYYVDYEPYNDCSAHFQYFGSNMAPMINTGDSVAVKRVNNLDLIEFGEPHYLVTNENANSMKVIKLLLCHADTSKVILRNANVDPMYLGDMIVNKSDIIALYSVKGGMTRFHM